MKYLKQTEEQEFYTEGDEGFLKKSPGCVELIYKGRPMYPIDHDRMVTADHLRALIHAAEQIGVAVDYDA